MAEITLFNVLAPHLKHNKERQLLPRPKICLHFRMPEEMAGTFKILKENQVTIMECLKVLAPRLTIHGKDICKYLNIQEKYQKNIW